MKKLIVLLFWPLGALASEPPQNFYIEAPAPALYPQKIGKLVYSSPVREHPCDPEYHTWCVFSRVVYQDEAGEFHEGRLYYTCWKDGRGLYCEYADKALQIRARYKHCQSENSGFRCWN